MGVFLKGQWVDSSYILLPRVILSHESEGYFLGNQKDFRSDHTKPGHPNTNPDWYKEHIWEVYEVIKL